VVWKTDDPALDKRLQQSFAGVSSRGGGIPLVAHGAGVGRGDDGGRGFVSRRVRRSWCGRRFRCRPRGLHTLSKERLCEHLGRFGDHPYAGRRVRNELVGDVILPIGEMIASVANLPFALNAARRRERVESAIRGVMFLR